MSLQIFDDKQIKQAQQQEQQEPKTPPGVNETLRKWQAERHKQLQISKEQEEFLHFTSMWSTNKARISEDSLRRSDSLAFSQYQKQKYEVERDLRNQKKFGKKVGSLLDNDAFLNVQQQLWEDDKNNENDQEQQSFSSTTSDNIEIQPPITSSPNNQKHLTGKLFFASPSQPQTGQRPSFRSQTMAQVIPKIQPKNAVIHMPHMKQQYSQIALAQKNVDLQRKKKAFYQKMTVESSNQKYPPLLRNYHNKFEASKLKNLMIETNAQKFFKAYGRVAQSQKLSTENVEEISRVSNRLVAEEKLRVKNEIRLTKMFNQTLTSRKANSLDTNKQFDIFTNIVNIRDEQYQALSNGKDSRQKTEKELNKINISTLRILQEQKDKQQLSRQFKNDELDETISPIKVNTSINYQSPMDKTFDKNSNEDLTKITLTQQIINRKLDKIKGEDLKPSLSVFQRLNEFDAKSKTFGNFFDKIKLESLRNQQNQEIDDIKRKLAEKKISISKLGLANSLLTPIPMICNSQTSIAQNQNLLENVFEKPITIKKR